MNVLRRTPGVFIEGSVHAGLFQMTMKEGVELHLKTVKPRR